MHSYPEAKLTQSHDHLKPEDCENQGTFIWTHGVPMIFGLGKVVQTATLVNTSTNAIQAGRRDVGHCENVAPTRPEHAIDLGMSTIGIGDMLQYISRQDKVESFVGKAERLEVLMLDTVHNGATGEVCRNVLAAAIFWQHMKSIMDCSAALCVID